MKELVTLGERAVEAKYVLQRVSTEEKNLVLQKVAEELVNKEQYLLEENKKDIDEGIQNHMNPGLLDRLRLTPERIAGMAEGIRQIVELPDPIGEILDHYTAENGLHIVKKRVPMGVIGIIYESRPNVTADAFGLCFKSGNAVILKGGSDAMNSNLAITKIIQDVLDQCSITPYAIQLIQSKDRQIVTEFMKMKEYVDLLIPRGGAGLIRHVVENSLIPVIETGTGNCHIYVDEFADIEKSIPIILNAKTQRIGVCNACESLVVHRKIVDCLMPLVTKALREKNVEIRGDERIQNCVDCVPATEEDFGTEYLDYIISVKTVDSLEEAIAHINHYNTKHSEAILTNDRERAEKFMNEVDAACVYWNASTRFTDGFEFGLGAEIGISTQKLHARGPMGLKELTSYKYVIDGDWLIRK